MAKEPGVNIYVLIPVTGVGICGIMPVTGGGGCAALGSKKRLFGICFVDLIVNVKVIIYTYNITVIVNSAGVRGAVNCGGNQPGFIQPSDTVSQGLMYAAAHIGDMIRLFITR